MDISPDPSLAPILASFRACGPIFAALGDPFRQDIIIHLAAAERLNVNAITALVPLSRPAISHHLKVLRQAGLVTLERVSRENFYSLTLEPGLAALRHLVEQAEASCT